MRPRTLLLATLLLLGPGAPPAPAADRPEVLLVLRTERDRVRLGDAIGFTVSLERKKGRPIEINALRLDRTSVSLRVSVGGTEHVVTRIHGEIVGGEDEPKVLRDLPPPRAVLVRGEPRNLEVPLVAVLPGRWTCRAVFAGMPDGFGELVSEPMELLVVAPGAEARIGALVDTTEGAVVLTLWPERAFNTVQNFLTLARRGFYDGLTFHRIAKGHLVQGGDPKGDGTGGPGYSIPDEIHPEARHEKGVISLARAPGVPDSGGSQFFVLLDSDRRLDGHFTAFGRVAEGMEVLDEISTRPVEPDPDEESSRPVEPPVILTVRPVVR